ncbi:MAG: transcription termination/antitermination protein NusG [Candidatus Azosocius agrarius]|nr:MAG: transcription termination/antitermination protein NusG [Gammaproteobacteria bacterium]
MFKYWYVIQVCSGFEFKVKSSLEKKIFDENIGDMFGKILIPTEEVMEIKSGKKRKSEKKFFPGYILIEMILNEKLWHLVRSIPKVLCFVGSTSGSPLPLTKIEAENILNKLSNGVYYSKPKILFDPGEFVRVIDGPFTDFNGTVEDVNYEKNRLCVAVLIFGRSTPVDLNFSQVEKY